MSTKGHLVKILISPVSNRKQHLRSCPSDPPQENGICVLQKRYEETCITLRNGPATSLGKEINRNSDSHLPVSITQFISER